MTRTDFRYGWKPDLPDHRDLYRIATPAQRLALPAKVDLSTDPAMPPVYDQQQIGSCTANGIAGAFEFDLRKQGITDFMPSRLFVYFNERKAERSVAYDSGAQIRDGIKSVATQGLVPETAWPYDGRPANDDGTWPAGHLAAKTPPKALYEQAVHNEAVEYQRVVQQADQMKACLAAGIPFVFGFTVYPSFESQEVAATGDAPMPGPDDSPLGGHCTMGVGYDDSRGVWICRNSWSASWGNKGYFTLPYAYLTNSQLSSDFWTVRKVS